MGRPLQTADSGKPIRIMAKSYPVVESGINNNNNNPDNLLKGSLFNLNESLPLNNLKGIERLLSKCATVKNNAFVY
jgi:hypothetical protein